MRPTRPEPSVVITSQVPATKASVTWSKSSNVFSVMLMPSTWASSEMLVSVVVPALVHTMAPSISLTSDWPVKPSLARPISCWPS